MSNTGDMTLTECGHNYHHDRPVDIRLDGPVEKIPDSPPIPKRLALHFPMLIWDWERYQHHVGYCSAHSEVSKSIGLQGMWEGYETVAVLEILKTGEGTVIDFGAGIGWYTIIAGLTGHHVVAFEHDPEILRLLSLNVALNQISVDIRAGWVDHLTPPLEPAGPVRLIKMDVEGAENHTTRMSIPILKHTDYVLMEVSPVFADHYPQTVKTVCEAGFLPYLIPVERPVEFGADPLHIIREYPLTHLKFDQRNVLFINEDKL